MRINASEAAAKQAWAAMNERATLPAELLARELRGPRYTSYPTALSFTTEFAVADYLACARESATRLTPLSLYVHIPFCASNCFYCGCNRVVSRNQERIERYLHALIEEIRLQSALYSPMQEVVQVHFGGGTPNNLDTGQLGLILDALRARFRFAPSDERELSMEVDPRLATAEDAYAWRALGFNRLSLGVQDVDLRVQQAINRIQTREQIALLTASARDAGFKSINYDLVYGLPMQTPARFRDTLAFVLEQRPERIAAYHYAHMPERLPAQRAIDSATLPSELDRQRLRADIHDTLCGAGYVAIGLDHYALPDDPLAIAQANGSLRRNFQGYSTLAGTDLIGLGASSISQVGRCYAQNFADVERYQAAMETQRLALWKGYRRSLDDRLRGEVIESVMCQGRVDFALLRRRYDIDPAHYFGEELERLRALDPGHDWLNIDEGGVAVDEQGRNLLRVVAMVFDTHLRQGALEQRFSKVV